VIISYQARLLEHVREHHAGSSCDGYFAQMLLPDDAEGRVGFLAGFGIGAPCAAIRLEDLAAFGVRRVVSVGTAGSLQSDIGIGDIVVCDRAIRDEGVSHHYLPPARHATPSEALTHRLRSALDAAGRPYRVGTSWTIDAPYRETFAEVKHYQREGVLTVEMEAAALFAVAERRGIELAAMFTISDSLADLTWDPRFSSRETEAGLEALYLAALEALQSAD
jgi:uridine phosphorylase